MRKNYFILLVVFAATFSATAISAQGQYLGEVKMFGGNFAPRGWAFCDGQVLSITQFDALFSLIGTTYGGDGVATFALPDLRGRVPLGRGSNSGGLTVLVGENLGKENVSLIGSQLPVHAHQARISVSSSDGNLSAPTATSTVAKMGSLSGRAFVPALSYNTSTPDVSLGVTTTSSIGSSQPISLMKPFLGVNYIIALDGLYPSQN